MSTGLCEAAEIFQAISEHLTIDSQWYVYWKGKSVEHYTLSWMTPERVKESAEQLTAKCLRLEGESITVDCGTIMNAYCDEPLSDRWFGECFDRCVRSDVGRKASTEICKRFSITGMCDPPYIADVIDNCKSAAEAGSRIVGAYRSTVKEADRLEIETLIARAGKRNDEMD